MRLTEFWERMESRFGAAYADSVARDQVIGRLGNRTVHQALAQGESATDVWRAGCEHLELPVAERHGVSGGCAACRGAPPPLPRAAAPLVAGPQPRSLGRLRR